MWLLSNCRLFSLSPINLGSSSARPSCIVKHFMHSRYIVEMNNQTADLKTRIPGWLNFVDKWKLIWLMSWKALGHHWHYWNHSGISWVWNPHFLTGFKVILFIEYSTEFEPIAYAFRIDAVKIVLDTCNSTNCFRIRMVRTTILQLRSTFWK